MRPTLFGLWALGVHIGAAQVPAEKSTFISLRLDSRFSSSILVGRASGFALWLVEFETDLRDGHGALGSGVGLRLGGRNGSLIIGARAARSSQGWFGGLALWPTVGGRHVSATGALFVYAPFQGSGRVIFDVAPARLFVRVSSWCRFGAYYSARFASSATAAAGPSVQFTGSRWGVTLDAVRAINDATDEVRMTFRLLW
jgi:hypothetical protein